MIYVFLSFIIINKVYILIYIYCVCVCVCERVHFQVCESPCQGVAVEVRRHWFSRTCWVLASLKPKLGSELLSYCSGPGVTGVCHCVPLFCGCWDLNSGHYACAEVTLLTEPSPDNVYLNEGMWLLTSLAMDDYYTTYHLDEQAWHQS